MCWSILKSLFLQFLYWIIFPALTFVPLKWERRQFSCYHIQPEAKVSYKFHSEISLKILIYFHLVQLKDSFLGKCIVFYIFCLPVLDYSLSKINNTLPIQESRGWKWKAPIRSYSLSRSKIRIISCSTCFWEVAQRQSLHFCPFQFQPDSQLLCSTSD